MRTAKLLLPPPSPCLRPNSPAFLLLSTLPLRPPSRSQPSDRDGRRRSRPPRLSPSSRPPSSLRLPPTRSLLLLPPLEVQSGRVRGPARTRTTRVKDASTTSTARLEPVTRTAISPSIRPTSPRISRTARFRDRRLDLQVSRRDRCRVRGSPREGTGTVRMEAGDLEDGVTLPHRG